MLTAKFRAERYPVDYYDPGEQLSFKFCQHINAKLRHEALFFFLQTDVLKHIHW